MPSQRGVSHRRRARAREHMRSWLEACQLVQISESLSGLHVETQATISRLGGSTSARLSIKSRESLPSLFLLGQMQQPRASCGHAHDMAQCMIGGHEAAPAPSQPISIGSGGKMSAVLAVHSTVARRSGHESMGHQGRLVSCHDFVVGEVPRAARSAWWRAMQLLERAEHNADDAGAPTGRR